MNVFTPSRITDDILYRILLNKCMKNINTCVPKTSLFITLSFFVFLKLVPALARVPIPH